MNSFKTAAAVFFAALSLLCGTANAQNIVSGKVLDAETREPEVAAVAQLLKEGQSLTYTITDSTGAFSLAVGSGGAATLRIENLGRKTIEREITLGGRCDLGEILIENDAELLESASVSALRNLVKVNANSLSYDVEHDVDSKSLTVLDLLRKVPMVTVDAQDNISVNGSSSFKVYVDGRPNQMLTSNPSQMFKAMPASMIKSIEVVTNPGAKYDAEGAGGVLEIKTLGGSGQSVVEDGVYGTVMSGADTRGGTEGGLSLNAQKGKWTFGGNLNGSRQHFPAVEASGKTVYDNGGIQTLIETSTTGKSNSNNLMGNLNISFEPDTNNLFSASAGLFRFGNSSQAPDARTAYSVDGVGTYGYTSDSDSKMSWTSLNASFDYQHIFKNNRERLLNLSYQYSGTPYKNNSLMNLTYDTGLSEKRTSENDDRSDEHTFQADFTTPLGKGQTLSSGLKYIYRHNSADDFYNESESIYDYYNHIGAAYSEYNALLGRFAITAGVRYEHTFQKVNYGEVYKNFSTDYGNLVPNASVQWNLGDMNNLALSYNMRIRRPDIEILNPYVDQIDPEKKSYGNPDITAVRNHNIRLAFNTASPKWVLSLGLSERIIAGDIESYSFYDGSVLNTTYGNIVQRSSTGLDAFANYNISSQTRLFMNGNLYYVRENSSYLGQSNNSWMAEAFVGCQTTIFWKMRLSAMSFYNSRNYSLQGYTNGLGFAMLSLTKTFFEDKLSVSFQGMTPYSGSRLKIYSYSEGKGFTSESTKMVPLQSVGLHLSYTFGQSRYASGKSVRRSINNDDIDRSTGGSSTGGVNLPTM